MTIHTHEITNVLTQINATMPQDFPQKIMAYLDLTNLNENCDTTAIQTLCTEATQNQVAAVCVYPTFVAEAKKNLQNSTVKLATVANFPKGNESLKEIQDLSQIV